jgi:hypothetical protein
LLGKAASLQLGRDSDSEAARRALDTLRRAGDRKALELAVRRTVADGPATAIRLVAADVSLDASTRTTGPTDLALLQRGGDLLDVETADRAVGWLLGTLQDPTSFVIRTSPSYVLYPRLVDTLAGVLLAASPTGRRAVIDHLLTMDGQEDQLLATSWSRVVRRMPTELWNDEDAARVGEKADAHRQDLRLPLLGVAARHDPAARERLMEEARNGSLDALAALGDVRDLPTDVVTNLIPELSQRVDGQVLEAQGGRFGFGHDVGHALAVLNVWHPGAADWDPLLNLLQAPTVIGDHKQGALEVLTSLTERLPEDVQSRLREIAAAIAEQPLPEHLSPLGDRRDASGPPLSWPTCSAHSTTTPPQITSVPLSPVVQAVADRLSRWPSSWGTSEY